MEAFDTVTDPVERDCLVGFVDLTGFVRMVRDLSSMEVFHLLSDWYELTDDVVRGGGGRVVKFIGDAALLVFPAEQAESGIRALRSLKTQTENRLRERGLKSKLVVKAHFGSALCGLIGTRERKSFDIFGETVNTTALLPSQGFAITPEAFRQLGTEARKLFKKHTPPIRYISVEETHHD